ncbi:MAG: 30S ribosomal protein S17 [Desulfuromonadales bacterium]|jgi:small subunit ribosomal protein S17
MTNVRGNRKERVGVVVSDKMDKTVVVKVDNIVKHPIYKKYIKRRVTYKAHDEQNACTAGDKVLIVESRPLSKNKRWRVREILEKHVNV